MNPRIRSVVAVDSTVDRHLVQSVIPSDDVVEVVSVLEIYDGASTMLEDLSADVILVACDEHNEAILPFIEQCVSQRPTRPVVVLAAGSPNGFVRRAFGAGADDILPLNAATTNDQVLFVLQKVVARRTENPVNAGKQLGPMVSVLGPKGGVGKTLTACNLGVATARAGKRVTVVDLDLQFGDIGLALGLTPDRTIWDLATSGGSVDPGKLDAYLMNHSSGLRALLAPTRPDQAGAITVDFLKQLYGVLRSMNDLVIIDTPPGFTPEVLSAIDASTEVCMVGMLDSLSLKNTKLGLEALERLGFERRHVKLLLNRADSRVGITPADVAAIVGRHPDVQVPSHRDVAVSVNEGVPITLGQPRSPAARAFTALADAYGTAFKPVPAPGHAAKTGLFRRRAARSA